MRSARAEVAIFLRAYNQLRSGIASAEAELAAFRNRVEKSVGDLGKKVALAVAAAATAATLVGAGFEQSMANVSSVANASREEMAALAGEARRLGANTAFTASQAAGAMYALASGGMKTREMLASTEGVLLLAGATLSDMTTAAEITMATLRQFNLPVEETTRVVNVFAAGISNSMLNMERLVDSMKYAAPMASRANMSLEETVGALMALHNAGVLASMAGTGLRMFLMELLSPNEKLQKVLKGTRMDVDGLGAAIDRLREANLSAGSLAEMFPARAFQGASALIAAGSEKLKEYTAQVTGTMTVWRMYQQQMDTVKMSFRILVSVIEETGITIFYSMRNRIKAGLDYVSGWVVANKDKILAFFAKLADVVSRVVPVMARLGLALWRVLVEVGNALKPVAGLFKDLLDYLDNNLDSLISAAKGVAVMVAALWALSRVLWILRVAFLSSGLGRMTAILIAGAAALGVVVEKTGGWAKAWIEVQVAIANAWENVRFFFDKLAVGAWVTTNSLSSLGEEVKLHFSIVLDHIKRFVELAGVTLAGVGEMMAQPWKAAGIAEGLKAALSVGFSGVGDEQRARLEEISRISRGVLSSLDYALTTQHEVNLARIEARADEARRRLAEKPSGDTTLPGFEIPKLDLPEMDWPAWADDVESTNTLAAANTLVVWDEFNSRLKQGYMETWDMLIATDMSGSEKRMAIWNSMKSKLWNLIGDITKRWIWGEATQLKATVATEKGKTAAEVTGTATRRGLGLSEMWLNLKTGAVNIWHAATSVFKALAGIPFVGIPLAIATVGVMVTFLKGLSKAFFYEGGPVGGPSGRDAVNAWLTRGEYVMPVEQTRRYFWELEAMRAGTYGQSAAAAPTGAPSSVVHRGGLTVNAPIIVPPGSFLLADNSETVRRLAKAVHRAITEAIEPTYRDTYGTAGAGG